MKLKYFYCLLGTLSALIFLIFSNIPIFARDVHKAGDIILESRTAQTPEGEVVRYELGRIFVPENRKSSNSRLISIGFARLKGKTLGKNIPVFLLPGGPGESSLTNFTEDDSGSKQRLANFIKYYSSVGDLIVVDQRGFSKYGDVLQFSMPQISLGKQWTLKTQTADLIRAAKTAALKYPEADLSSYTIRECAEDVNDLRRALGYEKIILTGQSFGSQWSFAVMRLHPEIVERAQLSAVEPLDHTYDMPSHIFTALERIAADADCDPNLMPYLPPGGMIAALKTVSERFKRSPIKVTVKNEKTGGMESVVLGVEDFRRSLLMPASALPAFIISLYHRRYEEWARNVIEDRRTADSPQTLIGPLIDTSLGVSAAREKLLKSDSAAEFTGFGAFKSYLDSAPYWTTPDMGDEFRRAVPSSIPILFIHGDWDTSTPVENVFGIQPYFPNSRTIIVRRGLHGARKALFDAYPEVLEKVIVFLRDGETKNLPAQISLPVPSFDRPKFVLKYDKNKSQ